MTAKRLFDLACRPSVSYWSRHCSPPARWVCSSTAVDRYFSARNASVDMESHLPSSSCGPCARPPGRVAAWSLPRETHGSPHVGGWLRRTKLDELPQLWNVLRGDMSFVGPRPEVARFIEHYPPDARERVLSIRPGITDPASLRFYNEAELLAGSTDPERDYIERILPDKVAAYLDYVEQRSFGGDLRLIPATLRAVSAGPGFARHD